VIVSCGDPATGVTQELYNLSSGQLERFTPDPSITQWCLDNVDYGGTCNAMAVGAQWIEFDESCYHCSDRFVFQNLATGRLVSDPTTRTTIPNLDGSTLSYKLCKPLRLARSAVRGIPPDATLLRFEGRLAIAQSEPQGPPQTTRSYVEHCCSKLKRRIGYAGQWVRGLPPRFPANARAIIWQPPPLIRGSRCPCFARPPRGVFLPSLQPFTVELPSSITSVSPNGAFELSLDERSLYVLDGNQNLWSAPAPK